MVKVIGKPGCCRIGAAGGKLLAPDRIGEDVVQGNDGLCLLSLRGEDELRQVGVDELALRSPELRPDVLGDVDEVRYHQMALLLVGVEQVDADDLLGINAGAKVDDVVGAIGGDQI